MTDKRLSALLGGLIGLSAAASVLIGGSYLITGGEVGELPTLPLLMLAGALFAAHKLLRKPEVNDEPR